MSRYYFCVKCLCDLTYTSMATVHCCNQLFCRNCITTHPPCNAGAEDLLKESWRDVVKKYRYVRTKFKDPYKILVAADKTVDELEKKFNKLLEEFE